MRRKDKLLHITKLNKRLNESKINEDFSDDMASYQERFTNPYDNDMANGYSDDNNVNDVISSGDVIESLINGRDMWAFERKLGFKNSSTQRAFDFDLRNRRDIYFEVETIDGQIMTGFIMAPDDEMIILKNRDGGLVGAVKIKDYPEKVAKAIMVAIKNNADSFYSDLGEGDKENYYRPFDNPDREDNYDPYELKEKFVGLGDDLEYVEEECGCSLKENQPTDVKNSKWFSDEDGERIMDIQVD